MHVTQLHYHKRRRLLDISFSNGTATQLSAEFLRVYSPSAEVRGHGNPKLVMHKKDVAISKLVPVGNYAVKLVFDDGHDSGIYSWIYLAELAAKQPQLWQQYLDRLNAANANRESLIPIKVR